MDLKYALKTKVLDHAKQYVLSLFHNFVLDSPL